MASITDFLMSYAPESLRQYGRMGLRPRTAKNKTAP